MTIECHEWPLPQNDLDAKAAVFELDVPTAISKWRDITYFILVDIFTTKPLRTLVQGNQNVYYLHQYSKLKSYSKNLRIPRLQLASSIKPFTVTHYRSQKVSLATEENVCVPNGLVYRVYDSATSNMAQDLMGSCGVRSLCTLQIPKGSYQSLQYAVDDTIHTSNFVLAHQSDCSQDMTMHEYIAFGHLRSGHRLQWQNIARSLLDGILNFTRCETNVLLTQAACEAGPAVINENRLIYRDTHSCLDDPSFCVDILQTLFNVIASVEKNWQGATAVRTLIMLAARILSISSSSKIHCLCLSFLNKARHVTVNWMQDLLMRLCDCENEEQSDIWASLLLEISLTCVATFDIDDQYIPMLLSNELELSILTECSITVNDLGPTISTELPNSTKRLLWQYTRTLHRMESVLMEIIIQAPSGLDKSIQKLWSSYKVGNGWTAIQTASTGWLETRMVSDTGDNSIVHYNVLGGNLLINGYPLSRLPRSYESNQSFIRLFGKVCIRTSVLIKSF
jgi:hypothetical protein